MTPTLAKMSSEGNRMADLSFTELQRINVVRAKRWHKGGLDEWSVNDWLAAFGIRPERMPAAQHAIGQQYSLIGGAA